MDDRSEFLRRFPAVWDFTAHRFPGAGPPLPAALLDLIAILEDWFGTRFCFAGDPPRPFEVSEISLARELAEVREARMRAETRLFCLADGVREGRVALFCTLPIPPVTRTESISFLVTERVLREPVSRVSDLVARLCTAFGAAWGRIEEERLRTLYRADRVQERLLAASPEPLRAYLPPPPDFSEEKRAIPALLVPDDFDERLVPDGVWWINYWSRDYVEAVGEARVRDAGWASVCEEADGSLLLVATREPLDVENPSHREQVRRIVTNLGLADLQHRHRTS